MPASGPPLYKEPKSEVPTPILPLDLPGVNFSALLMPGFHITTPTGTWMNDPNGMMEWDGIKHVFFQLNPHGPVWGPPSWGHVVSKDLIRWKWLPSALDPSKWWDADGVFSGSAGIMPGGGSPYLMYTGVLNFSEWGFYYQLQAVAYPSNTSDPLLQSWIKPDLANPLSMNLPPGGTHAQFRDPVTPWSIDRETVQQQYPALINALLSFQNNGTASSSTSTNFTTVDADREDGIIAHSVDADYVMPESIRANEGPPDALRNESAPGAAESGSEVVWFSVVGALQDCVGSAALYASLDLKQWEYAGTLFSQLGDNFTEFKVCRNATEHEAGGIPPGTKGFGGGCNQFGDTCRMWECPDYFAVDGVQVFKYSDQVRRREPFGADWYLLSGSPGLNLSTCSAPFGGPADAFIPGSTNGQGRSVARQVDYGSVYASKTFELQDGRRIWLGWVYEDSLGCTEMCGDGSPFILDHQRWQGLLTLPRRVTANPVTSTLVMFPVDEISTLRLMPPLYAEAEEAGTLLRTEEAATVHRIAEGPTHGVAPPGAPPAPPSAFSPSLETVNEASGLQDDSPANMCQRPAVGPTSGYASTVLVPELTSNSGPERRKLEIRVRFGIEGRLWPPRSARTETTAMTMNGTSGGIHIDEMGADGQPELNATPFEVGITLLTGLNTHTRVFLSGSVSWHPPSGLTARRSSPNGPHNSDQDLPSHRETVTALPVVDWMDVLVDRRCSGGVSSSAQQGGPVDIPPGGLPAGVNRMAPDADSSGDDVPEGGGSDTASTLFPLDLAVWVDHSVVEAYALGGHGRVTSRIYPLESDVAWGVLAWAKCESADVRMQAEVYEVDSSIWIAD